MKTSKLFLGIIAVLMLINPSCAKAKGGLGGLLKGIAKACGAKEGSVIMDIADVGDKIGNAVIAKKTNDALTKYGGEQIESYHRWSQQYNDNQDRKIQSYLSEVDRYKMDYCKAHGFYDSWVNQYGDEWYEKAGRQWFDSQNEVSRSRTGDEILPWHLREDIGELTDRANSRKVETDLKDIVLNAVHLSMEDVNRAEQWIGANNYDKRDMIIDEAFNIVGNHSSNRELVDIFCRMAKVNNAYLRDKANGGEAGTMALTKMALDLQDIVFDSYQYAKTRKKEYLAKKLNIADQLIALGYEGDMQFASEIAGTILSIQNNKKMTEHEKHEWLRLLGYYGNEDMVEQIAEQINTMDDVTIDHILAESKEPSIDCSVVEAQKKTEREALEKKNAIDSINSLSIDSYLFDETRLTDEQKNMLNSVVNVLTKYSDLNVYIIGHTCNVGCKSVNIKVGLKRATEAKKYLIDKGIAAERLSVGSKGELEPIANNSIIDNRKFNRRITFVIHE